MSAIMENGKNGCSSPKMCPRAKLPITEPPKVWVSGSPSVDGNAKLVSAITEMGKMSIAPQKRVLEQNFQLLTPLKFGSPVLRVLTEMQNWCWLLRKMGEMAIAPQKRILEQNF